MKKAGGRRPINDLILTPFFEKVAFTGEVISNKSKNLSQAHEKFAFKFATFFSVQK